MEFLVNFIRFMVILGFLIFIHELGHFMVAKKVGIFIYRFSVGFGRKLLGFKIKQTEYWLSMIPFGGYVKMAGQEDMPDSEEDPDLDSDIEVPEDQKFYNKSVKERLSVVIAGPAMNFLLGVFLFILIYAVGLQMPVYMKRTVIGDIIKNSPAAKSGLQVGDEIVSVDGKALNQWKDLTRASLFNIDKELTMRINRDGKELDLKVTPSYYDKNANPGIGVLPYIKPIITDVMANSPADSGGLKNNDAIIKVNGKPVTFTNVAETIKYTETKTIKLTVERDGKELVLDIVPEEIGTIKGLDIYNNKIIYVKESLFPKVKIGDEIVSVDTHSFKTTKEMIDYLTTKINSKIIFEMKRPGGKIFQPAIEQITVIADVTKGKQIGVYFSPDPEMITEKYPIHIAILKGTSRAFESAIELFTSLYYLATGKISPKELAGPIGIYKITKDFAKNGFIMLLSLVAFLSVNLSVINLLPIPVLDGGHVFFITIEGIRGKPLNAKIMEVCQKIGFALLMALIVYTFYNDIVHRIIGK